VQGVDGITAISQRMAQIQATIAALAPRTSATRAFATVSTGSAAAFSSVLDREVAASAPAPVPVAASPASSGLTAAGIPADLAAYGNGKIPPSALREVGSTGKSLWAPASAAMEKMIAAARADGVSLPISDAYRTYDSQVTLAKEKGLYSHGGLAAKPGTSNHGWGLSVDLSLDSKAQTWVNANAATFGFSNDVGREPWHWTYGQG
jgi:D-alanyl-D-alanine carboxypeptidase